MSWIRNTGFYAIDGINYYFWKFWAGSGSGSETNSFGSATLKKAGKTSEALQRFLAVVYYHKLKVL
jgi:hypothetical protein